MYIAYITLLSLLSVILIIKYSHFFENINEEVSISDERKIHSQPVPRIGGVIFIPLCICFFLQNNSLLNGILTIAFLLMLIGLNEDIRKNSSQYLRLIIITAVISYFVVQNNFYVENFDSNYFDFIERSKIFSIVFVILGLLFFVNGFNFVDGTNGLMLGISIIILMNLCFFSFSVDTELFFFTIAMLMVSLIIFLFNFPFGKIFSGDSGSYFLGFSIGSLCIYYANSNLLEPLHIACLVFYPVSEIFITFWRRIFVNKKNPFNPDDLHLHILIYKSIAKNRYFEKLNQNYKSSLTTFFILTPIILSSVSISILNEFVNLFTLFLIYCFIYLFFYIYAYKKWSNLKIRN